MKVLERDKIKDDRVEQFKGNMEKFSEMLEKGGFSNLYQFNKPFSKLVNDFIDSLDNLAYRGDMLETLLEVTKADRDELKGLIDNRFRAREGSRKYATFSEVAKRLSTG